MKAKIKNIDLMKVKDNENTYYGFSQEWYKDIWQQKAGCGATVASSIINYYNQIDNFFEENELLKMMNLIDDIKKAHEKVNDKSYDKLHKYAESFFRKSSLEKSLKEILNIMKIFNEEYKKNWNKEIELKSSDTEVKCVNKEEIERRNL